MKMILIVMAAVMLGACATTPMEQEVATMPRTNDGPPAWTASPSAPLPSGWPEPGSADKVIVKQYPAYRAAIVRKQGDRSTSNGMFYPLFNHIKKNEIPMSSPVEMGYSDDGVESMAFIYAERTMGATGADGAVQVIDVPAMTVASIGVAGSYNDKRFRAAYEKVGAWLKDHEKEYVVSGKPRYLAYNSPFVLPFMKYGEVQVPVRKRSE